jgi:site-specific recombinase XerD
MDPITLPIVTFAHHDAVVKKKHLHLSTSGMRKIVEAIATEVGVPNFHPHLFRHRFGVTLFKETGNLAVVQDLMGHASPASTRIYAKIAASDLQEAHGQVWGKAAEKN